MTREEQIFEASKKFSEYEYNQTNFENGFINGAKWADKNPVNVWHDASEMPKEGGWILIQFDDDIYETFALSDIDADTFCDCCKKYGVIRWAYISDLLPKRGKK